MKAGIVTIYDVPNFGSVLQAYATQEILNNFGFEAVFIDYNRYNDWRLSQGCAKKGSKVRIFLRNLGLKADHRKSLLLERFKKEYFNVTQTYQDLNELKNEEWDDYGLFAVGSDQVWNTNYLKGDSFYLLSFVPDKIKKIAIASSFALKVLPEQFKGKFTKYLSRFDALSVRETNGQRIINEDLKIKRDVKLLLDPTLLFSKEQWNHQFVRFMHKPKDKYILFYMWAYAFEPRPYIYEVTKYFQQKLGCKIIALEGCYSSCPSNLRMENRMDSTIPDFLSLFANAELVITSSFHGTAFALNYGRPLVSILPSTGDDRQKSLLESLGVANCGITIESEIEKINPFYDTKSEQRKLSDIRKENLNWIKNNIQQNNEHN